MKFNMTDLYVIGGMLLFMIYAAYRSRKLSTGVADFLSANRCAGRYLLTVAEGIGGVGAVSILASFQMYYKAGLVASWWGGKLAMPIGMIIMLSGWVIYRFRETRALTLAQFFEIRYSKRFRVFAGSICFLSGIINFGIFPLIAAQFFIRFYALPEEVVLFGLSISTQAAIMFFLLSISLYFTLISGQISVLITDFLQGMFFNLVLFSILIIILVKFGLKEIFEGLLIAPEGQSKVNPYDIGKMKDFSIWFFLLAIWAKFYGRMAWQGTQGYYSSAKSAHEAKMAGVLGQFRAWGFVLALGILPLAAYAVMHLPAHANKAAIVQQALDNIPNEELRSEAVVPLAMTVFLPRIVMSAFAAIMIAALISTWDTYLHSWGSILIQDVIVPLRKKPFTPKQHIRCLRLSIFGVAIFTFIFSMFFAPSVPIQLYFMITGAIWLGGAGIVIIGGLYWKKGSTTAAWAAMIFGSIVPLVSVIFDQIWFRVYDKHFIIGPKMGTIVSSFVAVTLYVLISLFGKTKFNLDRMLHRGKYSLTEEHAKVKPASKFSLKAMFGYSSEFTKGDKFIYGMVIGKFILFLSLFLIMTFAGLFLNLSDRAWATYHRYFTTFMVSLAGIFAIWITIGGFRDLIYMLKEISTAKRNAADDGTVVGHRNLDEVLPNESTEENSETTN
jgi:solute:Na+ symporter, SSS family